MQSNLNNNFNKMNLNSTTPIVQETILEAPVVRETIKPEERFNIQENVERTIHQTEVKKVIQPIIEKEVAATQIHHNVLPTQHRGVVQTSQKDLDLHLHKGNHELHNTTVVAPVADLGTTQRGAIVHEHYDKKVIEQVQPIIYKEVVQPHIIETVQPIQETVYAAPILSRDVEVRAPIMSNTIHNSGVKHIYESAPIAAPIAPIVRSAPVVPTPPPAPAVFAPKQKIHVPKRKAFVAPIAPVAAVAPISGPVVTPVVTNPLYNQPLAHQTVTPAMAPAAAFNPAVRGIDHIPSSDPALVQGNAHVFPTSVNSAAMPTIGLNPNLPPAANPLINSQLNKGLVAPINTAALGKQTTINNPTVL